MRRDEEIRLAIALVGASFADRKLRDFVWGSQPESAACAWAAFEALGWVVGADESGFAATLEYLTLKLQQYSEQQQQEKKTYAS